MDYKTLFSLLLKMYFLLYFYETSDLSDKDRQMASKIDEARGAVAVMWEDRLL